MKKLIRKFKNSIDLNLFREDCRKLGLNLLTVGCVGGLISHLSQMTIIRILLFSSIGLTGLLLLYYGILRGND